MSHSDKVLEVLMPGLNRWTELLSEAMERMDLLEARLQVVEKHLREERFSELKNMLTGVPDEKTE